jgi:hypothetical protein
MTHYIICPSPARCKVRDHPLLWPFSHLCGFVCLHKELSPSTTMCMYHASRTRLLF